MRQAIGAAVAAAVLAAGGLRAEEASGRILYVVRQGGETVLLAAESGSDVTRILSKSSPSGLSPTPSGTALAWDRSRLYEIDRNGRTLWEISLDKIGEGTLVSLYGAEVLPGGTLLVRGVSREMQREWQKTVDLLIKEPPQASGDLRGRLEEVVNPVSVILEVNREGAVVHRVLAPSGLRAVHPDGDGLLVVTGSAVERWGWDGARATLLSLPKGYVAADARRLENGRFLVVAETGALDRQGRKGGKYGRIAEIDAEGNVIWFGRHDCPRSVQLLPGGGALVGAG